MIMEKESIAYFYLQYGQTAKQRFYSEPRMCVTHVEREHMSIDAVGIPEFYCKKSGVKRFWEKYKKSISDKSAGAGGEEKRSSEDRKESEKAANHQDRKGLKEKTGGETEKILKKESAAEINEVWEEKILEKELRRYLERSGAEWCWYGEDTAKFLGVKQPEIPFFFMEEMLDRYGVRERLILIGESNPLFDLIFQNDMPKVNFLQISAHEPEKFEDRAEWLYETYGIAAIFQRQRVILSGSGQAETLVIDMAEDDGADINISDLPAGTVYMDMGSKEKKRRQILKRNKNIRYLSPESLLNKWCHLDTNVQNGYNTRVN